MKKFCMVLLCGSFGIALMAAAANVDKPLNGEWDFRPQKVWAIDNADGSPFVRPAELRVSRDEMLAFHDFDRHVSYVFNRDGRFVNSFAKQGNGAGEVDRYLNCFVAGDRLVVATPGRLHFYSQQGVFSESFANNLFARFPLCFVSESEFLFAPQEMARPRGGTVGIAYFNLRTGRESPFAEFPAPGEGLANLPVIILGLTPQVKLDVDPMRGRVYCGRSDTYAIHVSDLKGTRRFSFGLDRKRIPAGEGEKRAHFESSGIPKDRYEKILPLLPGEMTQFLGIQAMGALIFVFPTEGLERKRDSVAVDIFSLDGKYLYRSRLCFGDGKPMRTHVENVVIRGDHCYALLADDSGKCILAKYKISLPPDR